MHSLTIQTFLQPREESRNENVILCYDDIVPDSTLLGFSGQVFSLLQSQRQPSFSMASLRLLSSFLFVGAVASFVPNPTLKSSALQMGQTGQADEESARVKRLLEENFPFHATRKRISLRCEISAA